MRLGIHLLLEGPGIAVLNIINHLPSMSAHVHLALDPTALVRDGTWHPKV